MQRFRQIDPGVLHLPPGRQDGAVPERYRQQVRDYGGDIVGMLPIEVTEGKNGEFMINNGVTRATRIHTLAPGYLVPIEVMEKRPRADFSRLKRVRDVPPPA